MILFQIIIEFMIRYLYIIMKLLYFRIQIYHNYLMTFKLHHWLNEPIYFLNYLDQII